MKTVWLMWKLFKLPSMQQLYIISIISFWTHCFHTNELILLSLTLVSEENTHHYELFQLKNHDYNTIENRGILLSYYYVPDKDIIVLSLLFSSFQKSKLKKAQPSSHANGSFIKGICIVTINKCLNILRIEVSFMIWSAWYFRTSSFETYWSIQMRLRCLRDKRRPAIWLLDITRFIKKFSCVPYIFTQKLRPHMVANQFFTVSAGLLGCFGSKIQSNECECIFTGSFLTACYNDHLTTFWCLFDMMYKSLIEHDFTSIKDFKNLVYIIFRWVIDNP